MDLLITIDYNHKNIRKILNTSKEEKSVVLEQYVIPKKQDNIKDILRWYDILLKHEIGNDKVPCIVWISPELIEKYVQFNIDINYDNLFTLKKLIEKIKKVEKLFIVKNFDEIFHLTGLKFINEGKPTNDIILDFIYNDKYYCKIF